MESREADRAFTKVCLPCTAAKGYRGTSDAAKEPCPDAAHAMHISYKTQWFVIAL